MKRKRNKKNRNPYKLPVTEKEKEALRQFIASYEHWLGEIDNALYSGSLSIKKRNRL